MAGNPNNEVFSLPSTEETLAPFRSLCLSESTPGNEPLVNITGFGALCGRSGGLGLRDRYWLSHSLRFCKSRGISVSKDFKYTPVNRSVQTWVVHTYDGPDFFDPRIQAQTPTDILICGYVLNPMTEKGWKLAQKEQNELGQKDMPREKQGILGQISPLHTQTSCMEAALGYKPKIIFVFSRCTSEIQGKQFASSEYLPITSKRVSAPHFDYGIHMYFDVFNSLNPPWPLVVNGHGQYKMDVLMQKDFAERNGYRRRGISSVFGLKNH